MCWQFCNFPFAIRIYNSFPKKPIIIVSPSVDSELWTGFDARLMHSNQIQIQLYAQNHIAAHRTYCFNKCCRLFFSLQRRPVAHCFRCRLVLDRWFCNGKKFICIHECTGKKYIYATEKHTKHKFPPVKIIIGNENNTNRCYMLRAKFQKGHWYVLPSILIHTCIYTYDKTHKVRISHGCTTAAPAKPTTTTSDWIVNIALGQKSNNKVNLVTNDNYRGNEQH